MGWATLWAIFSQKLSWSPCVDHVIAASGLIAINNCITKTQTKTVFPGRIVVVTILDTFLPRFGPFSGPFEPLFQPLFEATFWVTF
jgi:hypothetical protein